MREGFERLAVHPKIRSRSATTVDPPNQAPSAIKLNGYDKITTAFNETYSTDSVFGGAPNATAFIQAVQTEAGNNARFVALRGKTGWVYLAPTGSGTSSAAYRLIGPQLETDVTDPVELDRLRLLAAGKTARPRHSKAARYTLKQFYPGKPVGDAMREHDYLRKLVRDWPPDAPTQAPDDEWTFTPSPPGEYPKITLPGIVLGADISHLRHCFLNPDPIINEYKQTGGVIHVLFGGSPFIFACELFAGFSNSRWFSGETVQLGPRTYYMCLGAVQTATNPSGVIDTRVQQRFTVFPRDPAPAPGAPIPPLNLQPGEEKTPLILKPLTHVPPAFQVVPAPPDGPGLYEGPNGEFAPSESGQQPAGDNGGRGSSPPPSPPSSPSPSPTPSPTPRPLTLSVDIPAISPNGDGVKDSCTITVGAGDDWSLSVDGQGEIAAGESTDTVEVGVPFYGKVNNITLPEGKYTLRLKAGAQEKTADIVIDVSGPEISDVSLSQGEFKFESLSYRVIGTAIISDRLSSIVGGNSFLNVDIKGQGVSDIQFHSGSAPNTVEYSAKITIPADIAYAPTTSSAYHILQVPENPVVNVEISAADALGNRSTDVQSFTQHKPYSDLDPRLQTVISDLFPLYSGANEDLIAMGMLKVFIPAAGKEAGKAVSKESGKQISKKAGTELVDDLVANTPQFQTNLVWDRIKAVKIPIPGTMIPESFVLQMRSGQQIFVAPNATKHLGEFVNSWVKTQGPVFPDRFRLTNQVILEDATNIIEQATRGPYALDKLFIVNGWEIKIGAPRAGEILNVVYHLQKVSGK